MSEDTSENNAIIKQNIISKDLLLEIILTAIFVSFGLNLVVASFSNINGEFNIIMLIIGAIIVIISSISLIYINFKKFDRKFTINGFIVYDAKENRLIDVNDYGLSNKLVRDLNSAFKEDKSLETIWNNSPLRDICADQLIEKEDSVITAKEMIDELFEYFIFDRLSSTLTTFFYNDKFNEKDLKIYEREDIPETLLNNCFLNLFSKPMDQREAFGDLGEKKQNGVFLVDDDEKILFACYGKGGALYNRLHLVLPVGTNVKRHKPNGIVLESDQMIITFNILFDGTNTLLPRYFLNYYLDLKNEFVNINELNSILRFQVFNLKLSVGVKFKVRSLFSNSVWKYNKWLDNYLNSLNNEISKDHFFKSINWDQILAILYMVEEKNLINKFKKIGG